MAMSTLPPEAPNPNPIETMRKQIVDMANATQFFQALPIIHDEKGDVDQLVRVAIEKLNLACVFELGPGKVRFPALSAWAIDLKPTFTITERVLLNRDKNRPGYHGKIATDVLCELYAIFHPLQPGGSPVILEGHEQLANTGGVIIYQVTGKMSAGWREQK